MSYTPNIWVDREGTTRYFETIDTDGAKIFTPDYSQLTEIGTPVNADHMNHIEEGIAAGSFTKYNSSTTYKQNDLVTFFEDGKLKVYKSLKDENTNNEVANENYWEEVKLGGGGSSLPIGSTVVLDKVLSFEESQGLALQGTYVYKTAVAGERYGYPDFYNTYVGFKNNATAIQTTLGSSTITIYNNANGLKFYNIADKGVIDTFFNSTGVADFYGVDEANERIFLPRNNKFWQFTTNTNEVNNYVEAGLPDHTHTVTAQSNAGSSWGTNKPGWGNDDAWRNQYSTATTSKASASNNIYGKSDTVQPPASKKLLYYVVGNTVSDTSWIDVVTQVQGGVKDLEDKTQEGIERLKASSNALTTTQITNCITEIPQDIKLELNDGVLTLKAGSKVYMPNGVDVFDEIIIENDQHWNYGTGEFLILVNSNGVITGSKIEHIYSGTSSPTIVAGVVWYDTTNNIIKRSQTGTDWDEKKYALPISVVTTSSGSVTSIDQTFNGFGYIGSTVFVTKGVKGLIPNGRNEDGTLNNIEYTTDKVFVRTMPTANDNVYIGVFLDRNDIGTFPEKLLNPNWSIENYITNTSGEASTVLFFATATTTAGVISNFTPKLPFRAVDYSDYANGVVSTKAYITETYKNGKSWYRIY